MSSRSVRVYIVVNGAGDCRLTKRAPSLSWHEIAYPITIQLPSGWGKTYAETTLVVPDAYEPMVPAAGELVVPA